MGFPVFSLIRLLAVCGLCVSTLSAAAAVDVRLRVMSFNIWVGGEAGGQPLEQTVEVIRRSRADIVGLQERLGREVDGARPDHGPQIAAALGWNYHPQPSGRAILSRLPITHPTAAGFGAQIEYAPGRRLHFFNTHFAASPYQPYQLLNIDYGDAPFIKTAAAAIDWAQRSRGDEVTALLQDLNGPVTSGLPVILTGDFNEPSCLDWTKASVDAGHCPLAVDYPATRRVGNLGLVDAWRFVHADEVTFPGLTWTNTTSRGDPADHHDRIDFVFAAADAVEILNCEVVGESKQAADIVVQPWPSDHRAMVATLSLPPSAPQQSQRPTLPHPDAAANPHSPGEVDRPALVPFIVRQPTRLPGIVLDETSARLVGAWQYSTHTPPYVGLGYLHDCKSGKGQSSVTWTPDLPSSGTYEVRLSHCFNKRRSVSTPVRIHHAAGETTVRINQQETPEHDRLFRSLGRYRFHQGRHGWVRIGNEGTDGQYVIADAVQFLLLP